MATYNKVTERYEAYRFLSSIGLMVTGSGETKEEAITQMKEDLKFIREEMRKGTFFEQTGRGTFARPDLALYIKNEMEKNNEKKSNSN